MSCTKQKYNVNYKVEVELISPGKAAALQQENDATVNFFMMQSPNIGEESAIGKAIIDGNGVGAKGLNIGVFSTQGMQINVGAVILEEVFHTMVGNNFTTFGPADDPSHNNVPENKVGGRYKSVCDGTTSGNNQVTAVDLGALLKAAGLTCYPKLDYEGKSVLVAAIVGKDAGRLVKPTIDIH